MKFKSELLNKHLDRRNVVIRKGCIKLQPYDTDLQREEIPIIKALKREEFELETRIVLYNCTVDGLWETNKLLLDNSTCIERW